LPAVFFAHDHPQWVVAERVRDNQWVRLCRGVYTARDLAPREHVLGRIVGVAGRTRTVHWFSHQSAAVLWGLPLLSLPEQTHLRQTVRPSTKRDMSVVRHFGVVGPCDQATVNGLAVTGLALTAADCLRSLAPLDALVVADGALRAGADPARIDALIGTARGSVCARAIAGLADPGPESVPETSTRFALLAAGLPVPQTQVQVDTAHGVYWGDLGYPQWKVLIEYDGKEKYHSTDAFFRERERDEAIVAQGWRLVRLTHKDLRDPARLVRRVVEALPPGVGLTPRPYLGRYTQPGRPKSAREFDG